MRTNLVLLAAGILLAFSTMGSSCINDNFLVAVNLPINGCYDINPGPNLGFTGSTTLVLQDQLDESYRGNIKAARYYDIQVSTRGTYNGTVVGVGKINGITLLNYGSGPNATAPAPWSVFATPQSLLGGSPYIKYQPQGVAELVRLLGLLPQGNPVQVTLSSDGTLAGQTPVPAGLSVCIQVLTQVDAQVK
jgi:hypothetical protein